MNLSNLKKNESGVISAIRLSGSIKRRLSDMGMTPGATVKMLRLAPLGDPVEFRVLYEKRTPKKFLFTRW